MRASARGRCLRTAERVPAVSDDDGAADREQGEGEHAGGAETGVAPVDAAVRADRRGLRQFGEHRLAQRLLMRGRATPWGDGTVALVDLASGRLRARLPARNGAVSEGLAFTADGRRLVTGGFAGTVTIWDVQTQAVVRRLRFGGRVFSTALSPDGRLLAVTWQRQGDTGPRVEVRDLPADHTRYVRSLGHGAGDLAFSADGSALVALGCCRGGSVVAAWDATTGQRRFARRPEGQATSFALLPDSRGVLVGDADGGIARWDLRSGKAVGPTTTVSNGGISQVTVSPDGRMFAVGTFDSVASLWDLNSLDRIGEAFPIERGNIPAVAFDPNGRLLITELGSAILWPLDRPTLQQFACRVAGRTLTRDEWNDVLPDRPYRHVCQQAEATQQRARRGR
jgi:WD40 repeat protein